MKTQNVDEYSSSEEDYVPSIFSTKVLELISKAIGENFTGSEILNVLKSEGIENVEYPKTKWRILFDLFSDIQTGIVVPEKSKAKVKIPYDGTKIISIIQEFLHPLNHNADEEKADKLAKEIEKIIKYDNLVMVHLKDKYIITNEEGRDVIFDEISEEKSYENDYEMRIQMEHEIQQKKLEEELKTKDLAKILSERKTIEEIYTLHQTYTDLLEVFCNNPQKPLEKMNDYYVYLRNIIKTKVLSLGLKYFKLNLYIPFKGDLFSAEKEWSDDALKGVITWDKVRPNLNHFHSEIGKFCRYAKKDDEKTSDEKKLEDINSFILKQKVEQENAEVELKSIPYEQALFITKLLVVRMANILDADCGGYIKMMDEVLNVHYVAIHEKINSLFSREDFKDIRNVMPEYLPEDLFEMAVDDSWDVWWSEGGSVGMMSFVGKVNTIWIQKGKKSYPISEDLITLLNETDLSVSDHKKRKAYQWSLMNKNAEDKNTKTGAGSKVNQNLYVTKIGDDFKYKGKLLSLSKNSNYYKVFCALYVLLPNGGEVKYGELIKEIKSRIPSTKSKSDEEMRKFIQGNLTDKHNGFTRYANIPQTEDNGKPLISLVRGSSVVFNNGPQ